jgi:ABC-type transport system involved in cytochrome c biogenesis permease subunit
VLQFKEIKKKQLGYLYTRLPSLQILDAMNSRAVTLGWLCLTIGLMVGMVWASQARVDFIGDPNLDRMSLRDPKIFVSVVTWVVYSFAVLARWMMGWTGRKAAWLSASGFAIVLINLVAVSYLFPPSSHTFQ